MIKKKLKDKIRRRLYDNIHPFNYNSDYGRFFDRVFNAVVKNEREYPDLPYDKDRDDIFAEYLNIPINERHNIKGKTKIVDSKYKPTIAKENKTYKAIPRDTIVEVYDANIRDTYKKPLQDAFMEYMNDIRLNGFDTYPEIGKNSVASVISPYSTFFSSHTIGNNVDEKGQYYSIYDNWDINPSFGEFGYSTYDWLNKYVEEGKDISKGIGTPVEFYDRIYLDDYYGVTQPTHATYLPEVIIKGKRSLENNGKK